MVPRLVFPLQLNPDEIFGVIEPAMPYHSRHLLCPAANHHFSPDRYRVGQGDSHARKGPVLDQARLLPWKPLLVIPCYGDPAQKSLARLGSALHHNIAIGDLL